MTALIFDIETGPLPDAELEEFFEYDETKIPGYHLIGKAFDPTSVKVGNMKDMLKINAKINEARQKFLDEQAIAEVALSTGRETAWEEFKSRAALSAVTGRVLAVGFYCTEWPNTYRTIALDEYWNEEHVVQLTLETIEQFIASGHKVIGHNIAGFDMPFLVRRAWKHGIRIPFAISNEMFAYRSAKLIDTLKEWRCGTRDDKESGKLGHIAKFFGYGGKTGSGADFHKLFFGTPEDRQAAIDYLINDLVLTHDVASRMRLV